MHVAYRLFSLSGGFATVAAISVAASIVIVPSPVALGRSTNSPAQPWARYVPKANNARTKLVEASTVRAPADSPYVPFGDTSPSGQTPPPPRPPDWRPPSSRPTFSATWVTDSALAALVSERVDREKLSPAAAETVYQDVRSRLHRDDVYVFYCHGATQYLEPSNIRAMTLRRKGDSTSEARGTVLDENTASVLTGLDWSRRYVVVCFPKRLADGSPLIRGADDTLELILPTGGSEKLVLEFSLKKLLAQEKRRAGVDEL